MSCTLLLLRHAKSSWEDSRASDHERKLAPRGLRDTPRMAQRFAEHGRLPDLIVSSNAMRAKQTATLFAEHAGIPESRIRLDGRIYLAGASAIVGVAAEQPDSVGCLMIVGHNPDFTRLANTLAADLDLDNLPTCGIVGIELDCERWSNIQTRHGRLIYLDYPKNDKPPFTH